MSLVRELLTCWPTSFPIAIDFHNGLADRPDEDNAITALEHPNRVCLLALLTTPFHFERPATVIREPFPAPTKLQLSLGYAYSPAILDGFVPVGGLPCLQELCLDAVSFKDLPSLSTRPPTSSPSVLPECRKAIGPHPRAWLYACLQ